MRALRFERATVPALAIDGHRVQGSLEIVRYLERTRPQPSLYPSDPEQRSRVEAAERWGEAELQPVPRRIFRFVAGRSQAVRRWMAADVVGMPLPDLMAAVNQPVARLMGRQVGVTEARVQADVEGLPAVLDRVEALIAAGTLAGATANAADLQILSSIRSLQSFSDLEPLLSGTVAATAAERLLPALPGPVPPALPREWLARGSSNSLIRR